MLIHLCRWRKAIHVDSCLLDALRAVLGVHLNLFSWEQKFDIGQQVGMLGQLFLILFNDRVNRVRIDGIFWLFVRLSGVWTRYYDVSIAHGG